VFVADQLIYLELQKTGGSHIRRLLKQMTNGSAEGKHNRLLAMPENKSVIGSIRNPWDWYVSLWAYGASGQGALRARTGRGPDFNYYYRMLPRAMGKNWLTPGELLVSLKRDIVKPKHHWQRTYSDPDDPLLFRTWLKLLFNEQRRFDIGEGYGFSPLSKHAGLLTYRYFRLFTLGDRVFRDQCLADASVIAEFDKEYNIATGIIRMESLEADFVRLLTRAGVLLTEQQSASILNKESGKTNISRRKPAAFYYDDEAIELVARGDKFLIEKYGYEPPV